MIAKVYPLVFPQIDWTGIQAYFNESNRREECPTRQLDKWGFNLSDPLAFIPAMKAFVQRDAASKHLQISFLFIIPSLVLDQLRDFNPTFKITVIDKNMLGLILTIVTADFSTWENAISSKIHFKNSPLVDYLDEVKMIFDSTCYRVWRKDASKISKIGQN